MITRLGPNGELQMRCLVLRQPYAYFMCTPELGGYIKDVENRKRSVTNELGPILISASATLDRSYFVEACDRARERCVPEEQMPRYDELQTGVLYGALRFTEQLPPVSLWDELHPWKFPGQVGYVCDRAMRLPARPVSGSQGVFYVTLTDEEQRLLRAAGLL